MIVSCQNIQWYVWVHRPPWSPPKNCRSTRSDLTHRGAQHSPDTAAGTTAGPRGLAAGWCPGCSAASSGPAYRPSPESSWLCSPARSASDGRSESPGTVEGKKKGEFGPFTPPTRGWDIELPFLTWPLQTCDWTDTCRLSLLLPESVETSDNRNFQIIV